MYVLTHIHGIIVSRCRAGWLVGRRLTMLCADSAADNANAHDDDAGAPGARSADREGGGRRERAAAATRT